MAEKKIRIGLLLDCPEAFDEMIRDAEEGTITYICQDGAGGEILAVCLPFGDYEKLAEAMKLAGKIREKEDDEQAT